MSDPNDEGTLDRMADRAAGHRSAARAASLVDRFVPLGGRMFSGMGQIAADLGVEAELDKQMLETIDKDLHDQPSVEGPGVDLAPILAVDPGFNDFNFRTAAREAFAKVRDARRTQHDREGAPLLSPALVSELDNEISGDVAAHRHHLLAMLQVESVTIVAAAVVDGREQLDVHIVVEAEEMDRDDRTTAIVGGDQVMRRWAEQWRFERDPKVDSSQSDEQHILSFGEDEWVIAHGGWVVTSIHRLSETEPSPLQVS